MRRSNLFFVIVISVIAGYFIYPFFNPPMETARVIESETTPQKAKSSVSATEAEEKSESLPKAVAEREKPVIVPEASSDQLERTDDSSQRNSGTNGSERRKRSRSGYGNTKTFTGMGASATIRDFSFYKLKKSEEQLAISETDPRLLLIRGTYTGLYEGDSYELQITDRFTILRVNEMDVITGPNETFLSNVNENGNSIQIANGKSKTYLDIKNWPNLTLSIGPIKSIRLSKF